MDNYIAVVFKDDQHAFDGLHKLWNLDALGDVTVHGAAVVHRDGLGNVRVATKQTDVGARTAVGVTLGALLGALAGPIGAMTAGAAAGVGAATGGLIGVTGDALKADEHEQAAHEAGFRIQPGESAVIAEVSEDWTTPIDTEMKRLGGTIYRRAKGAVRSDAFDDLYYPDSLVPYDYQPQFVQ